MEERFTYNCSLESFFEDYLRLKRPYINAVLTHLHKKESRLNDNPLKVLAQLLYYHYVYRNLDEIARWKMVFDYDTKMKICERLGMPDTHLNSYLSQLRRLKIVKRKQVDKWYVVYPHERVTMVFNLNVKMDEEQAYRQNG